GSENNRMMALQRALLAAIGTRALIRLPRRDLNAGQNLLNTAGYLLGLSKREPQPGETQSVPIDPNNLMHGQLFAGVVEEDDLNRHPDHGEPRPVVNASCNAALISARGKVTTKEGSCDFSRDTASLNARNVSGSASAV